MTFLKAIILSCLKAFKIFNSLRIRLVSMGVANGLVREEENPENLLNGHEFIGPSISCLYYHSKSTYCLS